MSVTFVTNEDKAILDQSISQLSEEIDNIKGNGGGGTSNVVMVDLAFDEEFNPLNASMTCDEIKNAVQTGKMVYLRTPPDGEYGSSLVPLVLTYDPFAKGSVFMGLSFAADSIAQHRILAFTVFLDGTFKVFASDLSEAAFFARDNMMADE